MTKEPDPSKFWWRKRTFWGGAALASVAAAESFGPSLMPRGGQHQALVTGASALGGWIAGVVATGRLTRSPSPERNLATSIGVTLAGLAAAAAIRPAEQEPLWKAGVRTAGLVTASGGLASSSVSAVAESPWKVGTAIAIAGTGAVAGGITISRGVNAQAQHRDRYDRPPPKVGRALASGAGVLGALGVLSAGWRHGGGAIAHSLEIRTGMPPLLARLTGNTSSAALWAGAGFGLYRAATRGLAIYDRVVDPGYDRPPESPMRSAGPGSVLTFARTGRQGRRFITDVPTTDEIERVMGTPAVNEPIRVFVGYDAARDREDRIDLAMDELRRTGAFDRSILVISCPAGTGYVNTLPMEVVDYVTLGEAASVAVQYARLPSLLAIQQTPDGAEHHRLLLEAIQTDNGETWFLRTKPARTRSSTKRSRASTSSGSMSRSGWERPTTANGGIRPFRVIPTLSRSERSRRSTASPISTATPTASGGRCSSPTTTIRSTGSRPRSSSGNRRG